MEDSVTGVIRVIPAVLKRIAALKPIRIIEILEMYSNPLIQFESAFKYFFEIGD